MSRYFNNVKVGLRDKDTSKLVAVYPEKVEGNEDEIRTRVFDWFYQQSCEAEHELEHCFVDVLTDNELKS